MRTLHVLPGLQDGGIERLAHQVIVHAPAGAVNVLLNTDSRQQQLRQVFADLETSGSLTIREWLPCDGLRLAWRSFWLCRRLRPDALLLFAFQRPMLLVAIGARLAGVPRLAVHLGNPAPASASRRRAWLLVLRLFCLLGVRPVPCSDAIVASFGGEGALQGGSVIPNGCDTAVIAHRAGLARRSRSSGDAPCLLMVARLDPIKDAATLLRAFAGLGRTSWRLQLVGDGPERPRLESLARELGLDPARILLGRRDDIPELLGRADLFAFSTTAAEGFGIALIEAMAAGLPIVASDVPACREVLLDGAAGVLLPPGDVAAWCEGLAGLIASPSRRLALATAATAAAHRYDSRTTASRWYGLLDR